MNYYMYSGFVPFQKSKIKGLWPMSVYILFNFHQERALLSFTDHVLAGIVTVVHHLFK